MEGKAFFILVSVDGMLCQFDSNQIAILPLRLPMDDFISIIL
jgi:hypothetical protein